jgi:hypothetical protein
MPIRGRRRTVVGVLSATILAVVTVVPVGAADPDASTFTAVPLKAGERATAHKAASSSLAETDPELLARTDGARVNVMIKLDYDAAASYRGQLPDLAATSPTTTGRPLTGRSTAEREYRTYIAAREAAVIAALEQAVPTATVGHRFRIVYGGVAAVIPARSVEAVLAIDGVVAVQYDRLNQLLTDASPEFVGADGAYDELGTTADAGAGLIYGNLDTGIWPEHPSFADLGNLSAPPGPARACQYGDNPLTPANDPFVCQNKLIGGAHFTDTYDVVEGDDPFEGTARDHDGHGTHTSSTTAGNIVEEAEVFGIDRGPIHGLAPGAWVMGYKVCGPQGCFTSDSAAAVQQAILDGVDVINFSISGGENPFTDPVELAFLDAYAAGVFVSASAGNGGPGAATVNHVAPWVMTVAASTQQREFGTSLTLAADDGDTADFDGASITVGVAELPVVLAQDVPGYTGGALCSAPAAPGSMDGLIVACQRGVNARVAKGFNVLQGGAEAMVLYNPSLADIETDNHWLPTIHLADGTDFLVFMDENTGVTGSFPTAEKRDAQGDVIAAFSSRGPGGRFIKPDVTAPGVQILAGAAPIAGDPEAGGGPPGQFFQAIAGTSMSSPHVAGAALLVRALHPDWTPGQVKSALMTTAVTDVLKEDLTTPADPFDMGAGRIEVGDSVFAPITFDESAEGFFVLGDDLVGAAHLNLPSVNAAIMPGRLVTTRVATNASGRRERFEITTDAPSGSTITVRPRNLIVQPFSSATMTITIESDAPIGAQQFGEITMTSSRGQVLHLPVAFVHTQGSLALSQVCSPATVQFRGLSRCTVEAANEGFDDQTVDLDTFTEAGLRIVATDGATIVGPRHAQLHGVDLGGASPGVPSFAAGASPGYIPLSAFGVAPEPIGDEEAINFGTPPYKYNGVTHTTIGVVSNGYLVAGGAVVDDISFDPPTGPNAARPNDFVAPLWADLDGSDATGIRAAVLTDGTNDWIVVEYDLEQFGSEAREIHQIWLGTSDDTSPGQDVTWAYGPASPITPTVDFEVGVENILGQGEMVSTLVTGDQVVTSTDPLPGDVVTYAVIVRGVQQGVHEVRTEAEATLVPGVTIVRTDVRVLSMQLRAMTRV